ncbi:MAG TPA: hypothetical protein VFS37_12395 [Conexibacter sp.]|nr:hypothetical protein [Conexibacter sp.]
MTDRIPMREVRGFNYSGSWGTSGLDLWQHHDNGLMAVEVARGKRFFPGWNVARWWLSHEAFQRNRERFLANFKAGVEIFDAHAIQVLPVLFNRWRDPVCDFGGVPLEHIVPGLSVFCPDGSFATAALASDQESVFGADDTHSLFGEYIAAVVGAHADDERILGWDLCNEPFLGAYLADPDSPVRAAEAQWLRWCGDMCRAVGAQQAITIGHGPIMAALELTEPLVDFISFHPYYLPEALPVEDPKPGTDWFASLHPKANYERFLDDAVAFAAHSGKELLASETCWGANDDADRAELIRYTLGELSKREIGFTVHALHHSLVADLHSAAYGPVGMPERLEFINADGSLRAGHEAFNEFVPGS